MQGLAWLAAHPDRSPLCCRCLQGVRSMARFYVCLYIPIFFGPYWAWLSSALGFGFAFFYSILVSDPPPPFPPKCVLCGGWLCGYGMCHSVAACTGMPRHQQLSL